MSACDEVRGAAVDHPVFDHEGPWTEESYLGLSRTGRNPSAPDDGRVELVDGALLVGPGTTGERRRVVGRVREAVEAALPDGLRVVGPVPLRLGPDCVLAPDLVVTRAVEEAAAPEEEPSDGEGEGGNGAPAATEVVDAADALMVLEVVGDHHGAVDRSFKPQLYARSRIPYSLLVDHDVPFAVANMIIGGRYHEYARASAGAVLRVEEPFRLEIDLTVVTSPEEEPQDHDEDQDRGRHEEQDAVRTGG
jgi:hypothetical protein